MSRTEHFAAGGRAARGAPLATGQGSLGKHDGAYHSVTWEKHADGHKAWITRHPVGKSEHGPAGSGDMSYPMGSGYNHPGAEKAARTHLFGSSENTSISKKLN